MVLQTLTAAFPLQMTRVDVFEQLFLLFLVLGTVVGVVVILYTIYNAYKYRDVEEGEEYDSGAERPELGELPTGGSGGRKLFLSFAISAVIIIVLILWAYTLLVYVEAGPDGNPGEDALEVHVEAIAFAWLFEYEGEVEGDRNELVVPEDRTIWVTVEARDVWHTFGISEFRVKADAIPGEVDETWFVADEPGEYEDAIECFELCGDGHSGMTADLIVLEEDEWDEWYEDRLEEAENDDEETDGDEETNDEGTNDGGED